MVALVDHLAAPDSKQRARAEEYVEKLRAKPYAPSPSDQLDEALLGYLEDGGEIVRAGDGVAFAATAYEEMTGRVVEHLRTEGTITLAQVRDMFGTSRKYAQALLEHMDGEHITRRVGDERVLQKRSQTGR